MAPIFKTSSGLPFAVYIEPSSSNRPALLKSLLSNGGAPASRIDKANAIVVDTHTGKGRACGREQLASDPERVVLFVEWIDACIDARQLLGEDLDWGNLRIQDPEILDESLYDDQVNDPHASGSHVKEEDHKDHRPWPTPTSPTRPVQGELPVPSGVLPGTTDVKPEIFDSVAGPSHHPASPGPRLSASLSPHKSSKAASPNVLNYGQLPVEPEYNRLFLSACEEWEKIKKEAETYVPSLKRKSQAFDKHVSLDRTATKSSRYSISQEQPSRSPDSSPSAYQPLAKKRRPPLPAGSTKRGPKLRESQSLVEDFASSQLLLSRPSTPPLDLELADDSDDVFEILPPQSPLPSTSRSPKKLFTYVDEPMQFSLQTDLPNRVAIIRLLRKHGGTTASKMEDASYIIVSKSMPQYQETVEEAGKVDRIAIPVAWINRCVEENRIVSTEGYAVDSGQKVPGTLTDEDIISAAMADRPPAPAPRSSWLKNKERGYRFTQLDQEYLQKSLAWTYARDSGFSLTEFFHYLAKNRSLRAYGLILFAAGALIFLSASFQQRLSLDDLFWESTPKTNLDSHVEDTYRQQLAAVRDIDRIPHSRTLGVAQCIYVIGLARRKDRREHMETLIKAMDIQVVWHNALDMHSKIVSEILERVRWVRAQSRIGHESEVPDPQGLRFQWLPDVGSVGPVPLRDGSDLWFDPGMTPLPVSPLPDTRPPVLRTAGEDMLLPNEPITRAQVSCWYSHYQVLLKIANGEDQVAIVLEDDIDMEWDLEKRLRGMWPHLPKDWDIVMLGHCMSDENENPPVRGHPHLHPSKHVLCTHAYAISRAGAQRLVRYLRTPLFAFSRPIDHAIQHFNHHKILNIYSVEPAVVIQTKNTVSDIVDGTGGVQTEWLADSALQRVVYLEKLKRQRQSS
ncbi:unnamed protein product [Rhizoctonia solani]|uniref:Glycosyltransferase family 25 protein n=1 Tax=Rhizoctonia solani AG-3 Rhs1AP TaxID=1086054 RepID=X8IUJ0_9AGAM|nr:glycosyltransferase family 25 protein [Rhizoctonia solani AG-3 Rhs1AP]CAE6521977.1 unnamed protein product [Rhizoctonia solani]